MDKEEKKNILYLSYDGRYTNFYSSIKMSYYYNFIFKSNVQNLSLESYDGYIIDLLIFKFEDINVTDLLKRILTFNKPVVIIYTSEIPKDFSGIKYLEDCFDIKFEHKDAAVIENSYDGYLPERNCGYAMTMTSKKGYGRAYVKNTNNCFILRFGNITIMHDCEFENGVNNIFLAKAKEKLLKNVMTISNEKDIPNWISDLKILDEEKIEEKINKIELNIQNLADEKTKLLEQLEKERKYKELLYTSGEQLVKIVKEVLTEMLGLSVQDIDLKKEDLSFDLDNKKVLVEVKGINTAIKRENVSQTLRHILDDAKANNIDDNEISDKYKGLLIINPYIKDSISVRKEKEIYSKVVIGDLKHYDICAIDTITLLGLYQKSRAGEKIDLKHIILNNNYIEPDFSIVQ